MDPARGERLPTFFKSYALEFRVVKVGPGGNRVEYDFLGADGDPAQPVYLESHVKFFEDSDAVYQTKEDGSPMQTAAHRERRGAKPIQVAVRRNGKLVDLDPLHPEAPPPDEVAGVQAAPVVQRPPNAVQVVLDPETRPAEPGIISRSDEEIVVQTSPDGRTVSAGSPRQRAMDEAAGRAKPAGFGVRVSRKRGTASAAAPAPAPAPSASSPALDGSGGVTSVRIGGQAATPAPAAPAAPAPATPPAPLPAAPAAPEGVDGSDPVDSTVSPPESPSGSQDGGAGEAPAAPPAAAPPEGLTSDELGTIPTASKDELVGMAKRVGVTVGRKRVEVLRADVAKAVGL